MVTNNLILRGETVREICEEIERELSPSTESVHLSRSYATMLLCSTLLSVCPNLKRITVPPCWYRRTPRKIREALGGVGVEIVELNLGKRCPRLPEEVFHEAESLFAEGHSVKEIAEMKGVSPSTLYAHGIARKAKRASQPPKEPLVAVAE